MESNDSVETQNQNEQTSTPDLNSSRTSDQPQTQTVQHEPINKPGVIVLQWLTYAFWGWTVVALGTLIGTTASYFINGTNTGGFTPYGIAAVLVLLPIAAICDVFYSKYEPLKKVGAASIVMVIHAVIFALLAIGSLIGVVFSIISLVTSNTSSKQVQVTIVTALSLAIIYSITFLRTLRPSKLQVINRLYLAAMVLVSLIVILLGVVGPINNERLTKNDRLFTDNASSLKNDIDTHARRNSSLPESLSEIDSLNPNVKKLIESKLITYNPNVKKKTILNDTSSRSRDYGYPEDYDYSSEYTYYYELCFDFKKADSYDSDYYSDYNYDKNEYSSYISTYGHKAGNVCYKLRTD